MLISAGEHCSLQTQESLICRLTCSAKIFLFSFCWCWKNNNTNHSFLSNKHQLLNIIKRRHSFFNLSLSSILYLSIMELPCGHQSLCKLVVYVFNLVLQHEWVSEVSQSCPTLGDPMDCSIPGSSVHGIFQARVLEDPDDLPHPGIEPGSPTLQADALLSEPPWKT